MSTPPRLPLTTGCWGIVYVDECIYLGEGVCLLSPRDLTNILSQLLVMTFYSKEAGAGSKHGWQSSTTSISSLSYIVICAYEGIGSGRKSFRSIHSAYANLRAHKFFHIPSTQFLCRTQDTPTTSTSGTLSLSERDSRTFREMGNCKKALAEVTKKLNTSMRGGG